MPSLCLTSSAEYLKRRACSRTARILVRLILQLRLVYQVQFRRLTLRDRDRLETVNREAMRVLLLAYFVLPPFQCSWRTLS